MLVVGVLVLLIGCWLLVGELVVGGKADVGR